MHIVIEVVLVSVFIFTIIHYYRIGFVKALFSICKFFISIAIAFSLSASLGAVISERFVLDPIKSTVDAKLHSVAEGLGEGTTIAEVINNLPEPVKVLIPAIDNSDGFLSSGISSDTVEEASLRISKGIAGTVSKICAFIVLFAASMIALTLLAFLLDKLCKLPLMKQANKFLGFAFGVLFGLFHAYLVSTIITLILHLLGVKSPELSIEAMKEKTIIYKFFENIDLSHLIVNMFK